MNDKFQLIDRLKLSKGIGCMYMNVNSDFCDYVSLWASEFLIDFESHKGMQEEEEFLDPECSN